METLHEIVLPVNNVRLFTDWDFKLNIDNLPVLKRKVLKLCNHWVESRPDV